MIKLRTLCIALYIVQNVAVSFAFDQTLVASAVGSEVVDATIQKIHDSGIFTSDYGFLRRIAYAETRFGELGLPVYEHGGLWQIDSTIQQALITSTTIATDLESVRTLFGLPEFLTSGSYEKPLESALAARLYIKHIQGTLPIPTSVTDQANWWKAHYRPSSTVTAFQNSAAALEVLDYENCGSSGADVFFLVDGASTIQASDFKHFLDFISATGRIFNQTTNRFGLSVFAATNTIYGYFFNDTSSDLSQLVARAMQPTGEPSSWIGSAIHNVVNNEFGIVSGVRDVSMTVPQVLVVLTANPSSDAVTTAANMAHTSGVTTFVVGANNALIAEMNLIAEDPNAAHTFYSPAFTGLLDFPQQLSYQLCRVSALVPTDTTFSTTVTPGKKLTFQVEVPASANTATIAISKSKTTAHGVVYISGSFKNPSPSYYDIAVEIPQGSSSISVNNLTSNSLSLRSSSSRLSRSHVTHLYVTVTSTGASSLDFTFSVTTTTTPDETTTSSTSTIPLTTSNTSLSIEVILIIVAICLLILVIVIVLCRFMCFPSFVCAKKEKPVHYPRILSHDVATSMQNIQEFTNNKAEVYDAVSIDMESVVVAVQPEPEEIVLRDEERHKKLRRNLENAMADGRDWREIQRCLNEFKRSVALAPCGEEDYTLLEEANRFIREDKKNHLHQQLVQGIEDEDLDLLRRTLKEINDAGLASPEDHNLFRDMAHARHLLERLGQLQKAREAVMSISQTMISEIRSYGSPPEAVKSVMISTYLLLGEKEENLLDWRNIRAMIGKMGKAALKRRVVECEAVDIKPLVAARVSQVVSGTNINEVEDISKAISYFYGWCDTMLEEVKDYHSIDDFESLLTPQAPVVEKKKLKRNKVSPLPTPEVGKINPVLAGDDLEDRLSPEGISTAIEHEEDNENNPESSSDNDSDEELSSEDVGMMGSRSSSPESNESVSKPSTSLSAVSYVASETSSPAQLETGDGPKIFI